MFKKLGDIASSVTEKVAEGARSFSSIPGQVVDHVQNPTAMLEAFKGVFPIVGPVARLYHQMFDWILVDEKYGLVNVVVDPEVKVVVRNVARLHERAGNGEVVFENEWNALGDEVESRVADPGKPSRAQAVLEAATTGVEDWSLLQFAIDSLIAVLAEGASQDAASAAAGAATMPIPIEVVRNAVRYQLTRVFRSLIVGV